VKSQHREEETRTEGAPASASPSASGAGGRGVDQVPPHGPAIPNLRRSLGWMAVGVGAWLGFRVLSMAPWAVERVYASWLGPTITGVLGTVTSAIPLPVAALLLLAAPVVAGWTLIREERRARERGRSRWWGAATWGVRVGEAVGIGALLFYLLWGLNYARPSLEARLGWEDPGTPDVEELRTLASEAVTETNAAYLELHDTEDAGRPTPSLPRAERDEALAAGWTEASAEVGSAAVPAGPRARVKTLGVPAVLRTLGIYGFYFPFTAEPIVNGGLPGMVEAVSAAHEQAHHRGLAPEDEASFVAFLVTTRSPHPHLRYTGWLYAQRRLLADLRRADRDAAERLAEARLPGVNRDLVAWADYLRAMQGPVNRVADRVNDAYLRSNRVEGGIRSYGMVTRLLVGWARANGGRLGSEG